MKVEICVPEGSARVLEPSFTGKSIFLSREVYDFLDQKGKLDELNNMNLVISFEQNRWEISDNPSIGTPGTIASVLFSVGGILSTTDNEAFVCQF